MAKLNNLKACELHVHSAGSLTASDLVELARDVYHDVDWSFHEDRYKDAFGSCPDPIGLFQDVYANKPGAISRLSKHFIYTDVDGGDFGRFGGMFSFGRAIVDHYGTLKRHGEPIRRTIAQHRREGVTYVEYRSSGGHCSYEDFKDYHFPRVSEIIAASRDGFEARYMPSLSRLDPMTDYERLRQLMDEHPEVASAIVGVDFCNIEEGLPPKIMRAFFERLTYDNAQNSNRSLGVGYHVGESFFDKSLESSVRWCHEVALIGAKRLGHATVLGLDPAVSVSRRSDAHENERVSERLDQIAYDLEHKVRLSSYGVDVDSQALQKERDGLCNSKPDETVKRLYDGYRLEEIRCRQSFVLDCLTEMGTVIESCPTSNLRIGGVPRPEDHPVHRFLRSDVNLAICADDPGVFGTTLADEVEWVAEHSEWERSRLAERLGDPFRFRMGKD